MIFSVKKIVSYMSTFMELLPGDVITPHAAGRRPHEAAALPEPASHLAAIGKRPAT